MNKLQFTSFLLIILVFCGYRNKKQKNKTKNYFCNKKQTRWLKTTEIYSLTVLGARSPRVSLGNQGAGRMMFPLGKSDYCFFSFCAGSPRLVVLLQSLPLTSYCFLLVCVCVCVCVCVKERERERMNGGIYSEGSKMWAISRRLESTFKIHPRAEGFLNNFLVQLLICI